MDTTLTILDYAGAALRAIDSTAMVVALVALAAILAAVAGFFGWRTRLYGAMVGGMIMNAIVKAEGGGYANALAAMAVTTALGFALGSVPMLVWLLNRRR